jgi:hypothetical protein
MTAAPVILNIVIGTVPLHPVYLGVVVDPLNPGAAFYLLLESGDFFLLETGDKIILE